MSLESNPGKQRRSVWGLKDEEFVADFCLVTKRTLSKRDHFIFKFHYLYGADWKLCCRRMGLDRGTFFHDVYRIEQILGKTFRELKPHALFPVDEYFNSTTREPMHSSLLFKVEMEELPKAAKLLRFPVKRAA